jgi:hypothetical protein
MAEFEPQVVLLKENGKYFNISDYWTLLLFDHFLIIMEEWCNCHTPLQCGKDVCSSYTITKR